MTRNILFFIGFILFCCCKNDRDINEIESYSYDESILEYCIDIRHKNINDRIVFLLSKDGKRMTTSIYAKEEKINNFTIRIDDKLSRLFIKTIHNQLQTSISFSTYKKGYSVSFLIFGNGDFLSMNYRNTVNFKQDISTDFDKLIMLLRKEKKVNSFFEQ